MEPCIQERSLEFFQKQLKEHEARLHEGDLLLQQLNNTSDDTHAIVKEMQRDLKDTNKRLFVDNGTPSMQTRIDRLTTFQKVATWCLGVGGMTLASVVGALILDAIRSS